MDIARRDALIPWILQDSGIKRGAENAATLSAAGGCETDRIDGVGGFVPDRRL